MKRDDFALHTSQWREEEKLSLGEAMHSLIFLFSNGKQDEDWNIKIDGKMLMFLSGLFHQVIHVALKSSCGGGAGGWASIWMTSETFEIFPIKTVPIEQNIKRQNELDSKFQKLIFVSFPSFPWQNVKRH